MKCSSPMPTPVATPTRLPHVPESPLPQWSSVAHQTPCFASAAPWSVSAQLQQPLPSLDEGDPAACAWWPVGYSWPRSPGVHPSVAKIFKMGNYLIIYHHLSDERDGRERAPLIQKEGRRRNDASGKLSFSGSFPMLVTTVDGKNIGLLGQQATPLASLVPSPACLLLATPLIQLASFVFVVSVG